MPIFNDCRFIGRLTTDPILRMTSDKTPVTTFSLAVDREYPDSKSVYHTDFPVFVAWKGQAEKVCSKYKKGDLLGIRGAYQVSAYKDKEGVKRFAPQFIISEVRLIARYKTSAPSSPSQDSDVSADHDMEGDFCPDEIYP